MPDELENYAARHTVFALRRRAKQTKGGLRTMALLESTENEVAAMLAKALDANMTRLPQAFTDIAQDSRRIVERMMVLDVFFFPRAIGCMIGSSVLVLAVCAVILWCAFRF
jgi:hypothetical protein